VHTKEHGGLCFSEAQGAAAKRAYSEQAPALIESSADSVEVAQCGVDADCSGGDVCVHTKEHGGLCFSEAQGAAAKRAYSEQAPALIETGADSVEVAQCGVDADCRGGDVCVHTQEHGGLCFSEAQGAAAKKAYSEQAPALIETGADVIELVQCSMDADCRGGDACVHTKEHGGLCFSEHESAAARQAFL